MERWNWCNKTEISSETIILCVVLLNNQAKEENKKIILLQFVYSRRCRRETKNLIKVSASVGFELFSQRFNGELLKQIKKKSSWLTEVFNVTNCHRCCWSETHTFAKWTWKNKKENIFSFSKNGRFAWKRLQHPTVVLWPVSMTNFSFLFRFDGVFLLHLQFVIGFHNFYFHFFLADLIIQMNFRFDDNKNKL